MQQMQFLPLLQSRFIARKGKRRVVWGWGELAGVQCKGGSVGPVLPNLLCFQIHFFHQMFPIGCAGAMLSLGC